MLQSCSGSRTFFSFSLQQNSDMAANLSGEYGLNLGVLILTTVNKTKRTSVFIWYSATFPAPSYQACPRGSALNAKQPGFAEKNTVWWSSASAASLSAYRLKIWYWDASVISWRGGEYCRRWGEQDVSDYSTDSGDLYLFYSTGLSRLL